MSEQSTGRPGSPGRSARPRWTSVTSSGVCVTLAMLMLVAASSAWSAWLRQGERTRLGSETAQRLAEVIALSASGLLARDDAAAVRALAVDAVRAPGVERCVIRLGDGRVVAHSDPTQVEAGGEIGRASALPAWDGRAGSVQQRTPGGQDRWVTVRPIEVDGRAVGAVEVSTISTARPLWGWREMSGAAALSMLGLLALWLTWSAHRGAFLATHAVQSALRAAAGGERDLDALRVNPRWGSEASAWNGILTDRQELRERLLDGRLEAAVEAAQQPTGLLETACDTLSQGLLLVDREGCIRFGNGASRVLLGLREGDLVGRGIGELLPEEPAQNLLASILSHGPRRRGVVEIRRGGDDDGSVLRVAVSRVERDGTTDALLLVEDVTQQRLSDRARDLFLANATHELRNPLTSIRLYVETALEDGEDDPQMRGKCLNVINQETRRLERMVGDMLSMAEIEAGSMRLSPGEVRLDGLFEELRADFDAAAGDKGISLTFDLPPKLPAIASDRDKLMMCLHNLVGNAIKYTPEGGSVVVRAELSASALCVHVQDNGIGIAPEEQERVFEKFYRARDRRVEKVTGTGLGLALAREVARLHGGDISVQSELNKGSVFTLTVPAPALAQAA